MATAALQNMCSDAELARTAVQYGAHQWLDALVRRLSSAPSLHRHRRVRLQRALCAPTPLSSLGLL